MSKDKWNVRWRLSKLSKDKIKLMQATATIKGVELTPEQAVDYIIADYYVQDYTPKTFKK
jgi:hypothetical protein